MQHDSSSVLAKATNTLHNTLCITRNLFKNLRLRIAIVRSAWRQPGVWDKVPEGSTLIFGYTRIYFQDSVGRVEKSSDAKNQLDSFSRFDRILTCDRQKQTDGHSMWVPVAVRQVWLRTAISVYYTTGQWLVSALAYRRAGKNDAIDLDSVKGKRAGDRAWWRWHRTDYSRIFARGMPCGYFLLSCAHRSQVTYSYTVQSRYLLLLWPLFAETTLISWTVDHCSHC